jgi:20S proteasome alpha/beta subunit
LNKLEILRGFHHKRWKPNGKAKVTIAIGLICKRAIIIASDSQTTYGAAKSLDCQKISLVQFRDAQVAVAASGISELSNKAVQIMQRKAKDISLETPETVPSVAQDAVREIRNHLVEINKGCFTDEGWKRFFIEENPFELLVGFYFKEHPHLFTINLDWAIPILVTGRYKGTGGGKNFAEYLLKEYLQSDPDFEFGLAVSVAVIDKTIDNIDGCGRPIWLGMVWPDDPVLLEARRRRFAGTDKPVLESRANWLAREEIDTLLSEVNINDKTAATTRSEQIREILKKYNKKRLDQMEAEIKVSQSVGESA